MKTPYQLDHLGNPVYRPKPDLQQRLLRWAMVITVAACVGIVVWVR